MSDCEICEETPIIVNYTYELPEHRIQLQLVQRASDMFDELATIHRYCKDILRYGVEQHELKDVCEIIRDDIDSIIGDLL